MIMLKALSKINSVNSVRTGLSDSIVSRVRASVSVCHNLTNHREIAYSNHRFFSQQTQNEQKNDTYKAEFENLKKEHEKDAEKTEKTADQPETTEDQKPKDTESVVKTEKNTGESGKTEFQVPKQPTFFGKMVDYIKDTMEETFPSEKYERKKKIKQAQARLQKMQEQVEYTEEELEKVVSSTCSE